MASSGKPKEGAAAGGGSAAALRRLADPLVGRVRAGELGALPVIGGLVVIWTALQIANPVFLSAPNLVNLAMESAPTGVIALGVVCVLLVGQIDLSVGSVSGLSAALVAVLAVSEGWPWPLAVLVCLAAGALIGWFYGQVHNRVGMPSFVISLAGLLAFLGIQLGLLGEKGAINLPFDSALVTFAQLAFVPAWLAYVLAAAGAAGYFWSGWSLARERERNGLEHRSVRSLAVRSAVLLAGLEFACWYLNLARGVGWMFVFFAALVAALHYALTRTQWGRSVHAVGGNREAARRAGINVRAVLTSAMAVCTVLAALGGVLAASRLAAANQSSGTGDVNLNAIAAAVIGGTSLFGGRGSAFSALLGVVVIQSIASGLTLLNLSSSIRFTVTGAVLLLSVGLDSIARRSRTEHGRA